MKTLTRRRFLAGAAGLAGAAVGGLTSCGSSVSISADPRELVLWYWSRSISPTLLDQAAKQIPDSDKHLRADVIGGTFDTKLRTSIAGGSYIPDITGINSNCALYFPNEDEFIDLNTLGAAERQDDYFPWKWKLGTSPSGRFLFWPMDTGPTGFYYRADIFDEAGVDPDPEAVTEAVRTWDSWIELGERLRRDADVALVSNATMLFNQFINASAERYFDTDDKPVYANEGSTVRQAWDTAVRAAQANVTGNLQIANDQNAAFVSGQTAGHIEAVWWAEILKDTAPDTAGKWRIASQPVKPGNSGGSFLAIPATCKDPEAAFAFATWLTTPQHQAETYNEIQLFPSSPASFAGGTITSEGEFFGDQDQLEFFSQAAEQVPITYISTYESQITAFALELANVETAGKDPERAWQDAVDQTDRVLRKREVI